MQDTIFQLEPNRLERAARTVKKPAAADGKLPSDLVNGRAMERNRYGNLKENASAGKSSAQPLASR